MSDQPQRFPPDKPDPQSCDGRAPSTPGATYFAVSSRNDGDGCRLLVRGDLVRATVRTLIDRLRAAEQSNISSLTVDLAHCDFIDRVGACVLLDAGRRARRDGWHFAVANPSPPAMRLFGLLGLHRTVELEFRGDGA